ncbi:MAG: hypothetical protein WHS82_06380, partial [Candidatus Methanosuratincola sp.]
YVPLLALNIAENRTAYGYGPLDLQTSQPNVDGEANTTNNYLKTYSDRISEAIPDSPAAPFLGPILVVSIGLTASAAVYISLRRKLRVSEI